MTVVLKIQKSLFGIAMQQPIQNHIKCSIAVKKSGTEQGTQNYRNTPHGPLAHADAYTLHELERAGCPTL